MEEYLRHTRQALGRLQDFDRVHVILGNESCDLDSAVSALCYAYFLNQTVVPDGSGRRNTCLYLPVLNIPRSQYPLRTEVTYVLRENGLTDDLLTFHNELDYDHLYENKNLTLTLVDHNVLAQKDSSLEAYVVGVIDHHAMERRENERVQMTIEGVGSCCTLVAECMFTRLDTDIIYMLDRTAALMLYGAILTDTINLSPEAGKTTAKDKDMIARLASLVPDVDAKQLYLNIEAVKFNVSDLSNEALLEKDVKFQQNNLLRVALCSITLYMQDLFTRPNFENDVSNFASKHNVSVVILMTLSVDRGQSPSRQIAVYSQNRIFRQQVTDILLHTSEPPLQLIHMKTDIDTITAFYQMNVQASRKKVMPIVVGFLNGEKSPEVPHIGSNNSGKTNDDHVSADNSDMNCRDVDVGEVTVTSGHDAAGGQVTALSDFDLDQFDPLSDLNTGLDSGAGSHILLYGMTLGTDSPSGLETPQTSGMQSPLVVSSGQASDAGSSYPHTPPNSLMENSTTLDGFVKDRTLPSFNSSEMVKRINERKAELDAAECVTPEHGIQSVTYTPQNSYSDSNIETYVNDMLPSFNNADTVQKIKNKQSLLNNVTADGDTVIDTGLVFDGNPSCPFTPYNSYVDKNGCGAYPGKQIVDLEHMDLENSVAIKRSSLEYSSATTMNSGHVREDNSVSRHITDSMCDDIIDVNIRGYSESSETVFAKRLASEMMNHLDNSGFNDSSVDEPQHVYNSYADKGLNNDSMNENVIANRVAKQICNSDDDDGRMDDDESLNVIASRISKSMNQDASSIINSDDDLTENILAARMANHMESSSSSPSSSAGEESDLDQSDNVVALRISDQMRELAATSVPRRPAARQCAAVKFAIDDDDDDNVIAHRIASDIQLSSPQQHSAGAPVDEEALIHIAEEFVQGILETARNQLMSEELSENVVAQRLARDMNEKLNSDSDSDTSPRLRRSSTSSSGLSLEDESMELSNAARDPARRASSDSEDNEPVDEPSVNSCSPPEYLQNLGLVNNNNDPTEEVAYAFVQDIIARALQEFPADMIFQQSQVLQNTPIQNNDKHVTTGRRSTPDSLDLNLNDIELVVKTKPVTPIAVETDYLPRVDPLHGNLHLVSRPSIGSDASIGIFQASLLADSEDTESTAIIEYEHEHEMHMSGEHSPDQDVMKDITSDVTIEDTRDMNRQTSSSSTENREHEMHMSGEHSPDQDVMRDITSDVTIEDTRDMNRQTSSSSTENRERLKDVVLTDEWQDEDYPSMMSEGDGSFHQRKQDDDSQSASRPNTLEDARYKIIPKINIFNESSEVISTDTENSDPDLMEDVDDIETPEGQDTPTDPGDPTIDDLEWENDTPVRSVGDAVLESPIEGEEDWRLVAIGEEEHNLDMRAIQPYKRVISHGGYYGDGLNAVVVFSGCYLPHRSVNNYDYIMDHLFYYVISTLDLLVAEDYIIVYFHGATPRKQMPGFRWLRRCYQFIDRRLKKTLKGLLLVHPTLWLKTVCLMTRPFISSKFSSKMQFVRSLEDLEKIVPMEYIYIPDLVRRYETRHIKSSTGLITPSTPSSVVAASTNH